MVARNPIGGPLAAALGVTLVVTVPGLAWAGQTIQPKQIPRGAIVQPQGEQAQDQQPGMTRATPGRAMKLDKATLKKLDTLPKDQLLEVEGKRMTAGEYKLKLRENQKKAAAKINSWRGGVALNPEALQADLDKAEEARINAANAKVMAEMAKIKKIGMEPLATPPSTNGNGAAAAIKKEAAEIQKRVQDGTATPADENRAKQLFEQYQQLK